MRPEGRNHGHLGAYLNDIILDRVIGGSITYRFQVHFLPLVVEELHRAWKQDCRKWRWGCYAIGGFLWQPWLQSEQGRRVHR